MKFSLLAVTMLISASPLVHAHSHWGACLPEEKTRCWDKVNHCHPMVPCDYEGRISCACNEHPQRLFQASNAANHTLNSVIETTLRNVDPFSWVFRPNNLYRSASYQANSAACETFPGTEERIACTVSVAATVDTCPGQPAVIDQLVYRIILANQETIIATVHDGGPNSTHFACDRD